MAGYLMPTFFDGWELIRLDATLHNISPSHRKQVKIVFIPMQDGVEGRLKRIRKAMTRDDSLEAVAVRRRRTENPHVLRFRLVSHHQFIIESTLNPSSVLSVSQFSLLPSSLGECAVKALVWWPPPSSFRLFIVQPRILTCLVLSRVI